MVDIKKRKLCLFLLEEPSGIKEASILQFVPEERKMGRKEFKIL